MALIVQDNIMVLLSVESQKFSVQLCVGNTTQLKSTRYTAFGLAWWRHQMQTFSSLLALCEGNSPVTGGFPSQRPVTSGFDDFFTLICAWTNGWVDNRDASDLGRHRAHYDVIIMVWNAFERLTCHTMTASPWTQTVEHLTDLANGSLTQMKYPNGTLWK